MFLELRELVKFPHGLVLRPANEYILTNIVSKSLSRVLVRASCE